jgi:GntR family transcriptional regulator / MocR family aminotransferase
MEFHVSLVGSTNLTDDVYRQLKEAVLDGRLRAGEELPSTRELAQRLSVARNTVTNAFQRLIAEGYLVTRIGAGTFVAEHPQARVRRAPSGRALKPRKIWASLEREVLPRSGPAEFDFRVGAPDPTLFPWDVWRRLIAHHLRGRMPVAGYPVPEGAAPLRESIAHHLGLARAVHAGADDILVCSGAQQAFDLIGRVLVEPGACVAVEDPGYPAFRRALTAHGARVVPVRVDDQGIDVDALPSDATLVYVTPSHQYPLGTRMSLARRMALLSWSERHGAAIVEDDYDSEFRFDGRPLEPLQSLDRSGRVLYVGTFSKLLLPTLRLGFVVAPPTLMPSLRAAKRLTDSHGALELQRALADFISEGYFARHLRRLLRAYGERRQVLLASLERYFGDALLPLPDAAGLHVSAYCRDPEIDVEAWAARALARGVAVQPLRPYYQTRPRAGLALGYGLIASAKINEGISRLSASLEATKPSMRASAPRALQRG